MPNCPVCQGPLKANATQQSIGKLDGSLEAVLAASAGEVQGCEPCVVSILRFAKHSKSGKAFNFEDARLKPKSDSAVDFRKWRAQRLDSIQKVAYAQRFRNVSVRAPAKARNEDSDDDDDEDEGGDGFGLPLPKQAENAVVQSAPVAPALTATLKQAQHEQSKPEIIVKDAPSRAPVKPPVLPPAPPAAVSKPTPAATSASKGGTSTGSVKKGPGVVRRVLNVWSAALRSWSGASPSPSTPMSTESSPRSSFLRRHFSAPFKKKSVSFQTGPTTSLQSTASIVPEPTLDSAPAPSPPLLQSLLQSAQAQEAEVLEAPTPSQEREPSPSPAESPSEWDAVPVQPQPPVLPQEASKAPGSAATIPAEDASTENTSAPVMKHPVSDTLSPIRSISHPGRGSAFSLTRPTHSSGEAIPIQAQTHAPQVEKVVVLTPPLPILQPSAVRLPVQALPSTHPHHSNKLKKKRGKKKRSPRRKPRSKRASAARHVLPVKDASSTPWLLPLPSTSHRRSSIPSLSVVSYQASDDGYTSASDSYTTGSVLDSVLSLSSKVSRTSRRSSSGKRKKSPQRPPGQSIASVKTPQFSPRASRIAVAKKTVTARKSSSSVQGESHVDFAFLDRARNPLHSNARRSVTSAVLSSRLVWPK